MPLFAWFMLHSVQTPAKETDLAAIGYVFFVARVLAIFGRVLGSALSLRLTVLETPGNFACALATFALLCWTLEIDNTLTDYLTGNV